MGGGGNECKMQNAECRMDGEKARQFTAETQPLDHARAALSEVEGQSTRRKAETGERERRVTE